MKHTILKCLGFAVIFSTLFISCRKDKFDTEDSELGDGGITTVKFLEGPKNELYFSPFTNVKKVDLFSVRRDVNSSSSLQSSIKVKLTANTAAALTANPGYEVLPDAMYTLATNSTVVKTSTGYEFNFQPGESAKELTINLNGALYDLSKKYLLAFDITDGGGATITKQASKSVVVLISIKNKYDGVYIVTGNMVDVTSTSLTHASVAYYAGGYGDLIYQLRTISATSCAAWDDSIYGGFYGVISSGATGFSNYGTFNAVFTFDLATDKIVAVTNQSGQQAGANKRSGRLDPTGPVNAWVNGVMTVRYNMQQEAGITPALAAPYIRSTWNEVWTYQGQR
jgi:hypothetical protein